MSTRAIAITGAVALAATTALALADDDDKLILERMQFVERGAVLTVSTRIKALFDSSTFQALDTGIPSTVVLRLWVYPQGSTDPISFQLVQRTATYDLWDEVYLVSLEEPGGRRTKRVKYRAEALKLLTELDAMPVALLTVLPVDKVFALAMTVELNPVSKETLAEVRRWLSQGQGGGLDRGGSFFGSFVSVFVNPKIPEADRVLKIRSQPFYRPRP
ncbi:MAG: hypothetical protein H0T79_16095 [Deltaproteobacteria bacterium]|nr:hypothetical protein [Deltaproteobacteria bacterium]